MINDLTLRELASRQHGLVSVEQAIRLGYGERSRDRLVDGRRWVRQPGGVYRLLGAPFTDGQVAMAAVLGAGPGAAVTAATSAAWWGIPGNLLRPIQVIRPRDRADRTGGGHEHEPTLLLPHHVVVLDDLPVVVPARALFDIAGTRRGGANKPGWVKRMERMVDNAWSLRLVSGESMHAMLEEMAERGRPGIRVMRAVLAKRGLDYIPPASSLESRLVQIMEMEDLPVMRRQVNVGDGVRWIGRVDFADEELPFLIEVQSERFHRSLIDQQLDGERITALRAAGYIVVELTDNEVWLRRDVVVAKIRAGRRKAERLGARRQAA